METRKPETERPKAEAERTVPRQRSEAPIIDPPKPPPEIEIPQPIQARADEMITQATGADEAPPPPAVTRAADPVLPPTPTQAEADLMMGGSAETKDVPDPPPPPAPP